MKTKTLYQLRGFEGNDVSLEISLFDYGFACKKIKKDTYHVIIGTPDNYKGHYSTFEIHTFDSEHVLQTIGAISDTTLSSFLSYQGYEVSEGFSALQSVQNLFKLSGFSSFVSSFIDYFGKEELTGGYGPNETFQIK